MMLDIESVEFGDSDLEKVGVAYLSQKRALELVLRRLEGIKQDSKAVAKSTGNDDLFLFSSDLLSPILILREALT